MPLPQWLEEDYVNGTHSSESIVLINDEYDNDSMGSLLENQDDELRQTMDPASSSNANDTIAKAAPIQQRRRSLRIRSMSGKENAISALNRVRRPKSQKLVKRNQTKAKSPVVLSEKQSDFEWQSKLGKRKHSKAQDKQRFKSNLSASVWKYFTDIKPQIQSQPDSLELSTVAVGGIEPGDGPSNSNAGEQSSSSKEINFSAKCTICGERKQFQKGNAWNVKSHLEKVCFESHTFECFHPFS